MNYIKNQVFGYSKKEVQKHFKDLENQHQALLSQKKSELNILIKKTNKLLAEYNSLTQELNDINKKRDQFMYYVNNRIAEIENLVNNKQEEYQEAKQKSLHNLISKKTELEEVQKCIKEFKNDLTYIKYRQIQTRQVLDK